MIRRLGDRPHRQCAIHAAGIFQDNETQFKERNEIRYPHYKYLPSQFVDSFYADGSLRLGTLIDFKKMEEEDAERGDANEGKIDFDNMNPNDFYDLDGPIFGSMSCNNSYIFCSSKEYSRHLSQNIFKSDSCIRIDSVEFYHEITKVVASRSKIVASVGDVQYLSRNTIMNDALQWEGLPPQQQFFMAPPVARTKLEKYAHQHEIRAMWEPIVEESGQILAFFSSLSVESFPGHSVEQLKQMRSKINDEIEPVVIQAPAARAFTTRLDAPF